MYRLIRVMRKNEEDNKMSESNFKYIGVVQNTEQLTRLEVSSLTEIGLVPFVWVEDIGKFLYFIKGLWTLDKDMGEWEEIYRCDGIIINEKDGQQKVSFTKEFNDIVMEKEDFVDLIAALLKLNKVPVNYIIDKMDIEETTVQDLCEMDGGVLKLLLPEEDIERVMETYKYWMGLFVETNEEENVEENVGGVELTVINENNNVEEVDNGNWSFEDEGIPFYEECEEASDGINFEEDCSDDTVEEEDVVENLALEDITENFIDFGDFIIEEDEIVDEDDVNVNLSEMVEEVQETIDNVSTEGIVESIVQEMGDHTDNDVYDNVLVDLNEDEDEYWDEIEEEYYEDYDAELEDNHYECDDEYDDEPQEIPEMLQVQDVFGSQPLIRIKRPGAIIPSRFVKQDGESVNELVMDDNLAEKIPTFNENDLLVILKVRIQELLNITNVDGDKPFENDECLQNVMNKLVEAQMWLNLWSRIN